MYNVISKNKINFNPLILFHNKNSYAQIEKTSYNLINLLFYILFHIYNGINKLKENNNKIFL
jgi:hypothetical protein